MVESKRISTYNRLFDASTLDSVARPYFFDQYISSPFVTLDLCARLQPYGSAAHLCNFYKKVDARSLKSSLEGVRDSATQQVNFQDFANCEG